jgi:4'-phosphopantetheinyl transferase
MVFSPPAARYDRSVLQSVLSNRSIVNPDSLGQTVSFRSITDLAPNGRSSGLGLDGRTIHVWGFSLEGSEIVLDRFKAWLSKEERVRAARFIHREDQIRYTLAHGGLRAVLACYLGLDPVVLQFQAGATGKPILLDQHNDPYDLRFNLSHSHGRMLIAVAQGQDVGIDLELIRDKVEVVKLAERFYTPAEYQQVLSRAGADQARQFYRYWVAKEAVLKGQGVGLVSLQQCEIDCSETVASAAAKISPGAPMQAGWTIRWLNCGDGWQGAVSACGHEWVVRIVNELPR